MRCKWYDDDTIDGEINNDNNNNSNKKCVFDTDFVFRRSVNKVCR